MLVESRAGSSDPRAGISRKVRLPRCQGSSTITQRSAYCAGNSQEEVANLNQFSELDGKRHGCDRPPAASSTSKSASLSGYWERSAAQKSVGRRRKSTKVSTTRRVARKKGIETWRLIVDCELLRDTFRQNWGITFGIGMQRKVGLPRKETLRASLGLVPYGFSRLVASRFTHGAFSSLAKDLSRHHNVEVLYTHFCSSHCGSALAELRLVHSYFPFCWSNSVVCRIGLAPSPVEAPTGLH